VNPLAVLSKVPSEEITDVRLVGSYALNFTWADGHGAGIYTWEYLRTLAEDPRVTNDKVD
jgi:prepilin-type processing-associated H-X9-DG protein